MFTTLNDSRTRSLISNLTDITLRGRVHISTLKTVRSNYHSPSPRPPLCFPHPSSRGSLTDHTPASKCQLPAPPKCTHLAHMHPPVLVTKSLRRLRRVSSSDGVATVVGLICDEVAAATSLAEIMYASPDDNSDCFLKYVLVVILQLCIDVLPPRLIFPPVLLQNATDIVYQQLVVS